MIVDVGVDRGELLQRSHSSEPKHRPLASSYWKVAVLNAVVGVPSDHLLCRIPQIIHSGSVGAQAVRGDRSGRSVTLERLLHEAKRRDLVPGLCHVAFEDFAFVIDRAPQYSGSRR